MAEAVLPDSASDTESLLHCSVCRENFHPQSRLPRYLPCHHSFCGECLEKLEQEGQVKCPMCRRVAKVDGPFPVDDTHITFLERRLPAQAEEAPPCEDCPDKEKATVRCQDCSTNLCDACSKAHKRVKTARNHTMTDLTEIVKNPELLKLAPEKCDIHKDRPLEFFCKTCDLPVCATCGMKLHRNRHYVVDLVDVMNTMRQRFTSECEEFSETIEGLETKAASLKTVLENLDTDLNHANEDIEKTFEELQTALNRRKAALLAEVAARVKNNRLALEEELATVESQISSSKATRDYSQRLVQYGLPSQFAAHFKEEKVTKLLQEAKEIKEALTEGRLIGFDRKGLQQTKDAIETFGNIMDDAITWTLEDIQNLPGKGVYSDTAYFCDAEWRIKAETSGLGQSRQLDLFLCCSVANERSWSFTVKFELKILNFKGANQSKCLGTSHLFEPGGGSWGFDFMTLREVTDPKNGFVQDGKICIQGSFKLDLSKGLDQPVSEESDDSAGEEDAD